MFDGLVGENYIGIVPNIKEKKMLRDGDIIKGSTSSDLAGFIDIGSQSLVHAEAILNSIRELITSKETNNF